LSSARDRGSGARRMLRSGPDAAGKAVEGRHRRVRRRGRREELRHVEQLQAGRRSLQVRHREAGAA